MHDRYLIPPRSRTVQMLGSSLNTVESGRLTMLIELSPEAGNEAPARYERVWAEATPLDPLSRSAEGTDSPEASPSRDEESP